MSSAPTFTKTGTKGTETKLDSNIFGIEVKSHELLKQAYVSYQANARSNIAKTLDKSEVRGGGKKPWRQKGTGRARHGSIRSPIWKGGGITFGPNPIDNYKKQLNKKSKIVAIKQALSLAADRKAIKVIETFECKEGKVSQTVNLFNKMDLSRNILLVVSKKDELVDRATRNIPNVKAIQATYLNVFDVMNADHIVFSKKALEAVDKWLTIEGVK